MVSPIIYMPLLVAVINGLFNMIIQSCDVLHIVNPLAPLYQSEQAVMLNSLGIKQ